MKLAYLILAHKNPAQLAHLVKALSSENSYFFIHIDAKLDIEIFQSIFNQSKIRNFVFINDRENISWGGFNMIKATVSLINFLIETGIKVDYVHLISGQDYPLKSNDEMNNFLRMNYGKNFLQYFTLPFQNWPGNQGMDRIWYRWTENRTNSHQIFLEFQKAIGYRRKFPKNSIPYGGSQWWTLHYDCVKFLHEECTHKNRLFRFYRNTYIPDEMIFHTMIMNSIFKETVINDNLRYINWQDGPQYPKLLTNEDMDVLVKSGKMFARKFEPLLDNSILIRLEKLRMNCNESSISELVIEEKNLPIATEKKWCIISTVGKDSLHKNWIANDSDFDLHLIVYDDSYEKFKQDTSYVIQSKGYKFKLVYDYLITNKDIIDQYDYFYLPDDDIQIDIANIHRLFRYMEKYKLAIAQPAVSNSYYTYHHTQKRAKSLLRFTNFVEIMQPCFSREALKKVLFTFNETKNGWGIDFHWGELVDYRQHNMAIIDNIVSLHTRPVLSTRDSNNFTILDEYVQKYNLKREIIETFD